jgi:hypothetical protein
VFRDFLNKITGRTGGDDSTAAGAAVAQREVFGRSLRVAQVGKRVKDLIQAHTWTPVEDVRKNPAHFYCLDMEEAGIDEVVNWVRDARDVAPFENRRVPIVYLIGPGHPLSTEELHAVNDELTPIGAYFFKRPDYRTSFDTAMQKLRDELERQYGSPETFDGWRSKENASGQLVTSS